MESPLRRDGNDRDPEVVTRLLRAADGGDREAFDRVVPLVYEELRRAARRRIRRERPGHTLRTTALVHEAYLRLAGGDRPEWRNSSHFLGVAARAMRQVLVDHARRRAAAKRGGDPHPALAPGEGGPAAARDPAEIPATTPIDPDDLLALDAALDSLREIDGRLARVVELRFFLGMPEEEIAERLGVSARTVERDWVKARAILHAAIYGRGRTR